MNHGLLDKHAKIKIYTITRYFQKDKIERFTVLLQNISVEHGKNFYGSYKESFYNLIVGSDSQPLALDEHEEVVLQIYDGRYTLQTYPSLGITVQIQPTDKDQICNCFENEC